MSLFTDGTPATIEFLRRYESSILDVAVSESIDLEAKLELAAEEIGDNLLVFVSAPRPGGGPAPSSLKMVVVTGALRRWHATHTLLMTFRDAFSSQLNDRYAAKRDEYKKIADQARELLFTLGVGIVSHPIPKAAVPSGGSESAVRYFLRMAWANASGQEGAPSDMVNLALEPGNVITPGPIPAGSAGWNVYIGDTTRSLHRQNNLLIPASTGWTFGGSVSPGIQPGTGQPPDYFIADRRAIPRA